MDHGWRHRCLWREERNCSSGYSTVTGCSFLPQFPVQMDGEKNLAALSTRQCRHCCIKGRFASRDPAAASFGTGLHSSQSSLLSIMRLEIQTLRKICSLQNLSGLWQRGLFSLLAEVTCPGAKKSPKMCPERCSAFSSGIFIPHGSPGEDLRSERS